MTIRPSWPGSNTTFIWLAQWITQVPNYWNELASASTEKVSEFAFLCRSRDPGTEKTNVMYSSLKLVMFEHPFWHNEGNFPVIVMSHKCLWWLLVVVLCKRKSTFHCVSYPDRIWLFNPCSLSAVFLFQLPVAIWDWSVSTLQTVQDVSVTTPEMDQQSALLSTLNVTTDSKLTGTTFSSVQIMDSGQLLTHPVEVCTMVSYMLSDGL